MTDLSKFVVAQDHSYSVSLSELRAGAKRSHWMWYIFPQIAGLGTSATAKKYAIANLDEARSYLDHRILGARLRECVSAVLAHKEKSAETIFGFPDNLKFCSSMTLFEVADPNEQMFSDALVSFYNGRRDERTLAILKGM